ncbi:hypothetical protein M3Y98_00198200 [Aphelenchoides besseyi]|nr:hypothetical protein M3Y98_00198200 [Aphelenchoides besseyi]KAI6200273.1 hypothetical protein M3Y96_00716000 [Aphelenchoides besseyi]
MSKTVEADAWKSVDITARKWLSMDVNIDSLASLIRSFDVRPMNVATNFKLFEMVDPKQIVGFVCTSATAIEFSRLVTSAQRRPLIPLTISNSDLTIALLNLFALNCPDSESANVYGELLKEYFGNQVDETYTILHSIQTVTPVPFVHNSTARRFPLKSNCHQHLNVFVRRQEETLLLGKDGNLHRFLESSLKGPEFYRHAQNQWKCDVYVLVQDPFLKTNALIEERRAELVALLSDEKSKENNTYLDRTLDNNDLHELSQLADQIDSAEDFQLMVDDNASTSFAEDSKTDDDQIRRIERQIRDLIKQQEQVKEVFRHLQWESAITAKKLLHSREYLDFYFFYKKIVSVNTPKALRIKDRVFTPTPPRRSTTARPSKKRTIQQEDRTSDEQSNKRRSTRIPKTLKQINK